MKKKLNNAPPKVSTSFKNAIIINTGEKQSLNSFEVLKLSILDKFKFFPFFLT